MNVNVEYEKTISTYSCSYVYLFCSCKLACSHFHVYYCQEEKINSNKVTQFNRLFDKSCQKTADSEIKVSELLVVIRSQR